MSDWIPWAGGTRPVAADVSVDVKLRSGDVSSVPRVAANYYWRHEDAPSDIIAYRVVQDSGIANEPGETILQEAQRLVHGDRQAAYGHPLDDFSKTAKMWSAILGVDVTAEQVGLCMICVKISRQLNAPKRDNMVDAAGYAATVQMCIEERTRRSKM